MSKNATKTVKLDLDGRSYDKDNPVVACIARIRLVPKDYFSHPMMNDSNIGELIEFVFSSDVAPGDIPELILSRSQNIKPRVCYGFPSALADDMQQGEVFQRQTITCLHSKDNTYHPGDTFNKTGDIIYRGEIKIVPQEYTCYVGTDPYKVIIQFDCCNHCISNVLPEIKLWIDKYIENIAGKDLTDPETNISLQLASGFVTKSLEDSMI